MSNVIMLPDVRTQTYGKTKTYSKPKQEWLVFQISTHGDPDGEWISVHPEDLPAWVTDSTVVTQMRNGTMVNGDPAKGRLWYRVQLATPPAGAA